MGRVKWSKVEAGQHVELKGRTFEVVKIKLKGGTAKVTVKGGGGTFESKVNGSDKVKLAADPHPLKDKSGRQQRWAKPAEVKNAGLEQGDTTQVEPPHKAKGDPWETRKDKVERRLDELLGAHLVAETDDASAGWYVPPVDISTVAAHVALFHDLDPSNYYSAVDLLAAHEVEHDGIDNGNGHLLKVNHWHTEVRP